MEFYKYHKFEGLYMDDKGWMCGKNILWLYENYGMKYIWIIYTNKNKWKNYV